MTEYNIPLLNSGDSGSTPRPAGRVSSWSAVIKRGGRLPRRRRLAVVDTTFPWAGSGFRYDEALEIHRRLPETLFFATHPCTDPFPAPVHPLAAFNDVAPGAGVTDIHIVFLNLALAVLGVPARTRPRVPGERDDLSLARTLRRWSMRTHVTLYPGGGLSPTTSDAVLQSLRTHATTIFTSVSDVSRVVPDAVPTSVPVSPSFYRPRKDAGRRDEPLRLVFVGDDRPRKGLAVLLEALPLLGFPWTLDVVGPHTRHEERLQIFGAKTHGWLAPEQLREVLRGCDVIVAPATRDLASDGYGDVGMVDGFPTTAVLCAMLAGCCLVGSKPTTATSPLVDGIDYLSFEERDPAGLALRLEQLAAHRDLRTRLAEHGRSTVIRTFDVAKVVDAKLRRMGVLV